MSAYYIRNIQTKEGWKAPSGKTVWKKPRDAKLAWGMQNDNVYQKTEETFEEFSERVVRREKSRGAKYFLEKKTYGNREEWRASFPKFDQQSEFEIVKLIDPSDAEALLKECEPHVPFELKIKIHEMLSQKY